MPRRPLTELFANDTALLALLGIAALGVGGVFAWQVAVAVGTFQSGGGASQLIGISLLVSVVFGSGAAGVAGVLRWRRTMRDAVVERDRAEASLRKAEEYHRLFRDASDAILLVEPRTGIVQDANRRACEVFDIPREYFMGRKLVSVTHDVRRLESRFQAILADGVEQEFETVHIRSDGTPIHFLVIARLIEFQGEQAVLISHRDISDRKQLEQKLAHDAFHDSLTGLANRALFRDRVEHAVTRTVRHPQQLIVMFLDLDNFKTINDNLGHACGDELLAAVAKRLSSCLRVTDTLARLGGDEFAILLEELRHPEDSVAVAERIAEEFAAAFCLAGTEVHVGTSIGIATSWGSDSTEELLRNADVAMYVAKSKGKGGYQIFEPGMHAQFLERTDLEADLRSAIQKDEFELHYQPIIELGSGQLAGVEALVRWNHPERGQLAPGSFIPLAEETGLIVPLGEWVLRTACDQMRMWQEAFAERAPAGVTVNISGRQLQEGDLPASVREALAASGLAANALTLELTEAVLMQDTDAVLEELRTIQESGVRIAIDDFGTGYSSLSYLRRLKADILKIDRGFIEGVGNREEDSALARAIIALADTLRMRTVAEGVRSQEQAIVLQTLGCELGQGFFFAPPVPSCRIDAILLRGPGFSLMGGEFSISDMATVI